MGLPKKKKKIEITERRNERVDIIAGLKEIKKDYKEIL